MDTRIPDIKFYKSQKILENNNTEQNIEKELENSKIDAIVNNIEDKAEIVLKNTGNVAVKDIKIRYESEKNVEIVVFDAKRVDFSCGQENIVEILIPEKIQPGQEGRIEIYFQKAKEPD